MQIRRQREKEGRHTHHTDCRASRSGEGSLLSSVARRGRRRTRSAASERAERRAGRSHHVLRYVCARHTRPPTHARRGSLHAFSTRGGSAFPSSSSRLPRPRHADNESKRKRERERENVCTRNQERGGEKEKRESVRMKRGTEKTRAEEEREKAVRAWRCLNERRESSSRSEPKIRGASGAAYRMALRSAPRCATLVGPRRLSSSCLVSSRRCSSLFAPFRPGGHASAARSRADFLSFSFSPSLLLFLSPFSRLVRTCYTAFRRVFRISR